MAWLRYRSSTDSSSDQGSHFHLSLLFLFAALLATDEDNDENDIYDEDNYDDDYDDHDDINDNDKDTGSKNQKERTC